LPHLSFSLNLSWRPDLDIFEMMGHYELVLAGNFKFDDRKAAGIVRHLCLKTLLRTAQLTASSKSVIPSAPERQDGAAFVAAFVDLHPSGSITCSRVFGGRPLMDRLSRNQP
jgi:hypothetical protein